MRVAIVVVGLVLLLVGIGGAFYGFAVANTTETLHTLTCTGTSPPPSAGFCQTLLATAASYRLLAYAMIVVFVAGVALAIAGAVVQEPPRMVAPPMIMPPPMPPVPMQDSGKACRSCGRRMPSVDRFCAYCGTPA